MSFIPHDNPTPILDQIKNIYGRRNIQDMNLKTFILYCQFVETAYKEWKDYWLDILTKES